MARPSKTGLDYYNLDTDIFLNRKIKRLIKHMSGKGFLIYSYILTEIYRDKGCFIVWDSDTAFDVSDFLNVPENVVNEVVSYCCKVGLFNKELLASESILTSVEIQERWSRISKDTKRIIIDISQINEKYKLSRNKTEFSIEEIDVSSPDYPQRKEKKRKEEKSIEETIIQSSNLEPPVQVIEIVPSNFTRPKTAPAYEQVEFFFHQQNKKQMARAFYDYYEGLNWHKGNTPIINWCSFASRWIANNTTNNTTNNQTNGKSERELYEERRKRSEERDRNRG